MTTSVKRTVWSGGIIAAALLVWLAYGAQAKVEKAKQPGLAHTVIFVLKPDAKDKVDELAADCHGILTKVPTVRDLWAGKPIAGSQRGPAGTEYDVGLTVIFDDAEGLKIYADHPKHLEFVRKWLPKLEPGTLKVFDFANP